MVGIPPGSNVTGSFYIGVTGLPDNYVLVDRYEDFNGRQPAPRSVCVLRMMCLRRMALQECTLVRGLDSAALLLRPSLTVPVTATCSTSK